VKFFFGLLRDRIAVIGQVAASGGGFWPHAGRNFHRDGVPASKNRPRGLTRVPQPALARGSSKHALCPGKPRVSGVVAGLREAGCLGLRRVLRQ